MSLIGLLTSTKKQVHLGQLHMRLIQRPLKNHWRISESQEKVSPIQESLHPHLKWWLQGGNVLQDQPPHSLSHAVQISTVASREGWGAHSGDLMARGTWSLPESKLHINYLEQKEFQDLYSTRIVLVATDNTTVVAYIKRKEA